MEMDDFFGKKLTMGVPYNLISCQEVRGSNRSSYEKSGDQKNLRTYLSYGESSYGESTVVWWNFNEDVSSLSKDILHQGQSPVLSDRLQGGFAWYFGSKLKADFLVCRLVVILAIAEFLNVVFPPFNEWMNEWMNKKYFFKSLRPNFC